MTTETCAMCGGPLTVALEAVDRNRRLSAQTFTYYRCGQCDTIQLLPVPSDLDRYYPSEYYSVPESRAALLHAIEAERYKLGIIKRFATGRRLVEIGPAVGAFLALMDEAGYDTCAIEMDAACSRFIRNALSIPVHQTADPIAALAAHGPFDVITMWHVIEHLPNPREVLAAAAVALTPGGILALAAPNPHSLQFRVLGPRWTHLDAPRHLFLIPIRQLVEVGRDLGLEPVLVTTLDEGTLGWNAFGWSESLAAFTQRRYPRAALRIVGSLLGRVMSPLDRHDSSGSTYTLVLRRPPGREA